MVTLKGKLTAPDETDFTRFGLTILFQRVVVPARRGDEGLLSPASVTARPAADGAFAVDLGPDDDVQGPFKLIVMSPAGNAVVERDIAPNDIGQPVTVEVTPVPPFTLPEGRDPLEGMRTSIKGRVLRTTGEPATAGLPVVLWGSADQNDPPRAVVTAATITGGYFSADWPSDRLLQAFATVSGLDAGPITLENERLPTRVILVLDLAEPAQEPTPECECEEASPRTPDQEDLVANPEAFSTDLGGKCVDFTMPNRVLEEFSFFAVVRTTQPDVKGLTADPPTVLPKPVVKKLLELAQRADLVRALSAPASGDETLSSGRSPNARSRESRVTAATTTRGQALADAKLHPQVVSDMLMGPGLFTSDNLALAERVSKYQNATSLINGALFTGTPRGPVSASNAIDWDSTATTYQAISVAHGHLLTCKQVWRADGYSLGDLLYSLPLAPCQKKQIAVIDWDRRAVTARMESRTAAESLQATVSRDRDISEIISTTLTESMRGGSKAKTWSAGGGFGAFIGPLVIGGGGGASGASSTAWQNSARHVAGSSLQQVRDRTLQAASSTRSQRSTVVQTVRQGETMRVQTEVVANHNHCHAVTMEYFEVLRHFQVSHELADAQECLFVPMAVSYFNGDRALRWRESLSTALRRPELAGGFDALQRVQSNWVNTDYPPARYADEEVRYLDGELHISFDLPRPADTDDTQLFDAAQWVPYHGLLTPADSTETQPQAAQRIWTTFLGLERPENRDRVWNTQLAPRIAARLVDQFRYELILDNNATQPLEMDTTLVSRFRQGTALLVSIRPVSSTPNVVRARIKTFRVTTAASLPVGGRVLVENGSARYRTDHLSRDLFNDYRVNNDLSSIDHVDVPVSLDAYEKSNPRARDRDLAEQLLDHLNGNVEHYLQATWMLMDPNKRYILLDSVPAPGAAGKSVASVCENRVLGIVGNCLVLPVAPGYHLDPTFAESDKATLFDAYRPTTPIPPIRVSVPTRGVFAEAVMGACNSCETPDETRFWRWEEAPCPDDPPRIQDVSTESRATGEPVLTPTPFASPLVRIQNAPDLPAPTSLAAAMNLIGTPNLFKDITGLDLNQQNAAAAFQSALDTAQFFGGRAADLAQQRFLNGDMDRTLKAISEAKKKGLLDDKGAQELTQQVLLGSVGDAQSGQSRPTSSAAVQRFLDRTAASTSSEVNVNRPEGSVTVKSGDTSSHVNYKVEPVVPFIRQPDLLTCWAAAAAMMYAWRHGEMASIEELLERLSVRWSEMFIAKQAIPNSALPDLMADLGLIAEPPARYVPRGIDRLLRTGPLWVVTDEDMTTNGMTHAEILTGIVGDGTPDNTKVLSNDPSQDEPRERSFSELQARLQATDVVKTGFGIYHFPSSS
jgi:Papain-like cysteine protease AvrRpt2